MLDDMPPAVVRYRQENIALEDPAPLRLKKVDKKEMANNGDENHEENHRDKRARHSPYYVFNFLSERCDEYINKNKRAELHPHKILSQLSQWDEKVTKYAMQKAANKEIDTWLDFDAVDIISPKEAAVIMKENPREGD